MMALDGAALAAIAGLVGGGVLGLAARLGRFCMMGAVEDAVYGGDLTRLRMLAMAAAVAVAVTALLSATGVIDPAATLYLRQGWSPLSVVLGGLIFGYGMAQVGTCGFGALARLGGGDLRALVMLIVIAVAGYATIHGVLAPLRLALTPAETLAAPQPSIAEWVDAELGTGTLLPSLLIAAGFACLALGPQLMRRGDAGPWTPLGWGAAAGGAVAFAWAATALAGQQSFGAVGMEGFSFVAPLGETVFSVMTGHLGDIVDFSVAAVIGVCLGSALGALWRAEFRWEACDDARELRRQLAGAALMGVGGVLAVGCSVGQGLSALSVLSASAPLVILSIFAGARIGLYVLVEGGLPERS
ncbi:MAG: YeeE/YedE family protein [Pseudomonadota bacterium]